jgi:hypothetical protein
MTSLDHLSYSSISSYLACGAAWKYHYLDKIKTPTSPELVFGSAFHGTVEHFIGSGHQGSLIDLWQSEWTKQLEQNPEITWEKDTPEGYCNLGVKMFADENIQKGILSIKAAQTSDGPFIEKKIELQVPGVPVPILGYIDIVTADGVPGDIKTSARAWTMDKALNEIQPLVYLAAMNQAGMPTPGMRFRHFVFVKTKAPQFQVMEHVHRPQEMFWLFGMIQKVWKGIEAGVFPENSGGWKCSPSYCEFWSGCRGK